MTKVQDPFGTRATLETGHGPLAFYRLSRLEELGIAQLSRLPFSIKVLLEAALRQCDEFTITQEDVMALARWSPSPAAAREIPFKPARVILQDFSGVPAIVDLAALRSAMQRLGGDPSRINPLVPVDLVIDHSVQVDYFGSAYALLYNAQREFERNRERYEFLRWGQQALANFRVVPPATGIVHQVNLEYLATVVQTRSQDGETVAFPDSLVGTDSHTTMINGLGVLGWGVGGIEAEAVMLGQPIYMLMPEVVGFKLYGELPEGATATDLVLTVTQMLRRKGVVDKFVEFYGPGLKHLSLPDRATIANMAPEYGATVGFFPVDEETLRYLAGTGREEELIDLVERYTKEQGLFRTDDTPDPEFSDTLELDMGTVEPSLAGPRRPQDRVPLREMKRAFLTALREAFGKEPSDERGEATDDAQDHKIRHGSVVIAAITSCTNTSNPSVMIGAGLLAKKAVERGLNVRPYVKTSLAPGSRVVSEYLRESGLLPYLEALRFHIVGFGCTTCIGNSGPLPDAVARAIAEDDLVVAAVLSGNRNFEGRIHPLVRANYLASPPLVVAYALAGRVDIDLLNEPLGYDPNGQPVYLRDIWPTQDEIQREIRRSLKPEMFRRQYADVFDGNELWNRIVAPEGELYAWDPNSTYIQEPPFFVDMPLEPPPLQDIRGARALVLLGDSITTDHISPAGSISAKSPAGRYLIEHGVPPEEFNSYGARRGNHEVMMRGTFANVRLKNLLVPGIEGGVTIYLPTGEQMTVYEAAMRYKAAGIPLVILAGKEYGTGSSRDWAAKGVSLLGVKAVLAESFERIHRSNLVGMGVLPLQFRPGESWQSLGLTGREVYEIEGIRDDLQPGQVITVRAKGEDGAERSFTMIARVDTPVEVHYYRNGGILPAVLRQILRHSAAPL
ncbi:MAG: aconitate hydratase AcnA [Anaerolineae bacterium]|nr:aconitate hydratase AcnA [Anaerolineae bacterium]MDW8100619.1 aconitate hydratase AcnA [Anaerolineae bacterium]